MKRFPVPSVDSPSSQENPLSSLQNKKHCTSDSIETPFSTQLQTLATLGINTQHQTSSLQHPTADGLLHQLISSQLGRTLPVGENLANFDIVRLGKSEDKSARQNGISNISDSFAQGSSERLLQLNSKDQLALINGIPMPLRNNVVGVYSNPLGIDFNPMKFSINNNTSTAALLNSLQKHPSLQEQRWNVETHQQNHFPFQKERHANDKLYGQVKQEEEHCNAQAFADEMELRISELIATQTKMLTDFREKNHLVQDSLKVALDEIKGLNQAIKRQNQFGPSKSPRTQQTITNLTDMASSELLINYLCGPNTDFEYNLILKSELQLPLYRERNFKFTVVLTDKQGNLIQNLEEFPLTLSIYSSETPPKSIEINNSGNKVLKGVNVKSMINGATSFEKIQIKEVTSHLRNGWIFIVVQPMAIQNEKANSKPVGSNRNKQPVDIKKIKPLVIDKIVVKAKKLKEKDNSEENDNN